MEPFLKGDSDYKEVTIGDIIQISPDSKLFRFLLPPDNVLGTSVGQFISIKALVYSPEHPEGKTVKRKYSPTSKIEARGMFEIPIKVYYPVPPAYPGGKLTTYLDKLKVGDKIEIAGPRGKYLYRGNGLCYMDKGSGLNKEVRFNSFGFIAGGTGITPCFQYIQYIIDRSEDIQVSLIFANKTEQDILLRQDLDFYASTQRLHLYYVLSQPHEDWQHGKGYVNEDMIRSHLPQPSDSSCIFFCGPKPMNKLLRELLPNLGYSNYIKF